MIVSPSKFEDNGNLLARIWWISLSGSEANGRTNQSDDIVKTSEGLSRHSNLSVVISVVPKDYRVNEEQEEEEARKDVVELE